MADLWVKLSVNAPDDPKVLDAGDHAELVFYRALCLAKRRNSDGVIARAQLRLLGADDDDVKVLVETELWSEIAQGWLITAWFKHNKPAAEIEADREREAKRKREYRDRHASRDDDVPADATRDTAVASAVAQSEQSRERVRVNVPPDATRDILLGRLVAQFRKGPKCTDPEHEALELLDQFSIETLQTALNQSVAANDKPYASSVSDRARKLQAARPRPDRPQCNTCSGTGWAGVDDDGNAIECPGCKAT